MYLRHFRLRQSSCVWTLSHLYVVARKKEQTASPNKTKLEFNKIVVDLIVIFQLSETRIGLKPFEKHYNTHQEWSAFISSASFSEQLCTHASDVFGISNERYNILLYARLLSLGMLGLN